MRVAVSRNGRSEHNSEHNPKLAHPHAGARQMHCVGCVRMRCVDNIVGAVIKTGAPAASASSNTVGCAQR
jgi:hypothetical protein